MRFREGWDEQQDTHSLKQVAWLAGYLLFARLPQVLSVPDVSTVLQVVPLECNLVLYLAN